MLWELRRPRTTEAGLGRSQVGLEVHASVEDSFDVNRALGLSVEHDM